MSLDFYTQHLHQFLKERPAISPDRLAEELSVQRANLRKIIQG